MATNTMNSNFSITETFVTAAGLTITATQLTATAVLSPAVVTLTILAGAVMGVSIEILGCKSNDAQLNGGISCVCTSVFGFIIPSEIKFGLLSKFGNFIEKISCGFLRSGSAITFFGKHFTFAAATPYLAGMNFGYMLGALSTRVICHITH